jgi:AcrR family transcriptional regulator
MTKKPTSKAGKILGNKGTGTRTLLLEAARRLMASTSPMNISASSIAKEAGVSGATFYVYFDDVEDILWTLCDAITEDTIDLFADPTLLCVAERLDEDALWLIRAYCDIWIRHGPILLYRNLEGDRGNTRFSLLLTKTALPILRGLTDRIVDQSKDGERLSRSEANAEAVVMIAAMDRIAAALHAIPNRA